MPLVIDGVSTLARMPSRLASTASPRVNITIPAIAAPITLSPGVGILAASEAMLTIVPRFASRMYGSAALQLRICANRQRSRMPGISSSPVRCSSRGVSLPPVELTSKSIRPSSLIAAAITACATSGRAMLPIATATVAPGKRAAISARAASARAGSRPLMSTAPAPAASKASAQARPMPDVPPVTTAVVPFSIAARPS